MGQGWFCYIITLEGELKIGAGHYFMSNSDEYVKAAGRIDIDGAGKIKVIEPESGHYRPNYEAKILEFLNKRRIKYKSDIFNSDADIAQLIFNDVEKLSTDLSKIIEYITVI